MTKHLKQVLVVMVVLAMSIVPTITHADDSQDQDKTKKKPVQHQQRPQQQHPQQHSQIQQQHPQQQQGQRPQQQQGQQQQGQHPQQQQGYNQDNHRIDGHQTVINGNRFHERAWQDAHSRQWQVHSEEWGNHDLQWREHRNDRQWQMNFAAQHQDWYQWHRDHQQYVQQQSAENGSDNSNSSSTDNPKYDVIHDVANLWVDIDRMGN